jgi:thymidylate synthase (FAD)
MSEELERPPATPEELPTAPTRRAVVPAMEEILGKAIPVLDHGFVRVVDYMGDDFAVVQAARVSYGKGTRKLREDRGLIRYLMRHLHSTPFEMCEIKLHVKMPIFVARQWVRHRTANINEYSARYSILDNDYYLPRKEHLGEQAVSNRQGRGEPVPEPEATETLRLIEEESRRAYANYQRLLNLDDEGRQQDPKRKGIARELARMVLPVNFYTQWYWKIDLHNLLHFLALRMDAHAQYEIRAYGDAIAGVVEKWVPFVWEAFTDYRLEGARLGRAELGAMREMIDGRKPDPEKLGMSKREVQEFEEALGIPLASK